MKFYRLVAKDELHTNKFLLSWPFYRVPVSSTNSNGFDNNLYKKSVSIIIELSKSLQQEIDSHTRSSQHSINFQYFLKVLQYPHTIIVFKMVT